jgi:hypothetical protein
LKPGIIFSAVFVVALLMALGLPQLTSAAPAYTGTAPVTAVSSSSQNQPAVHLSVLGGASAVGVQPATGGQPVATALPADRISANRSTSDSIPLTSVVSSAPELQSFIATVINNYPNQVVGVYVPGLFALPILQQPAGNFNFISPFDGALTQYAPPIEHGSISLLAHNYLAGRVFFNLQAGQKVILVYGDGRLQTYRVSSIDQYQALSPLDPYSNFIDQADPYASIQSFQQVYDRYYKVGGQLVFQTCVEKYGDLSWGRIFIVALPE